VLTAVTAAVLVASRFALLASGPWEWDETIFARGMLHFELAAHFPHPPGFPGLLALGHLLRPVAGAPYEALQWVSAIASVVALWPLAWLGRRVAPASVATSAALLVLVLPGPWLYSVRGFSTWPAAALALAAAAVWASGLGGRKLTLFTLLVTAAFLVRPILLPTLALLWLAGLTSVRSLRRVVPGLAVGLVMVAVAILVMARLEGGWSAFIRPFTVHGDFHMARLHRNLTGLEHLGLANGVGGPWPAAIMLAVSIVGVAVWRRRVGSRAAATWAVILGLTMAQLYALQNRSYARYAVAVQVAAAPLLAGAASLAPPAAAAAGLLGLAGITAWRSLPLVEEQHRDLFGAWEATQSAARIAGDRGWAVVVEPEVYVFASYWWHVLEADGADPPPMVLSPRAPEPWAGVDRPWLVATVHPHLYMPSLIEHNRSFGRISPALEPLTQNRFLTAETISNPPLPVGRWWTRERLPDGTPFMWAGPGAELWLPPVPAGTLVGLVVRPAPGDAPIRVTVDPGGMSAQVDGRGGEARLWFRLEDGSASRPVVVGLSRAAGYPPGGGDDRPLATQLLEVAVRPPGSVFGGAAATQRERWRLRLELDGAYGAEAFGDLGRGLWLEPQARLRLALTEPGRLLLGLASPRPTPANPTIRLDARVVEAPAAASGRFVVPVPVGRGEVADGAVEIDISCDPFVPARSGDSTDERSLGIVLLDVAFEPAERSDGWWSVESNAGG
jgi:hypothetical protein